MRNTSVLGRNFSQSRWQRAIEVVFPHDERFTQSIIKHQHGGVTSHLVHEWLQLHSLTLSIHARISLQLFKVFQYYESDFLQQSSDIKS